MGCMVAPPQNYVVAFGKKQAYTLELISGSTLFFPKPVYRPARFGIPGFSNFTSYELLFPGVNKCAACQLAILTNIRVVPKEHTMTANMKSLRSLVLLLAVGAFPAFLSSQANLPLLRSLIQLPVSKSPPCGEQPRCGYQGAFSSHPVGGSRRLRNAWILGRSERGTCSVLLEQRQFRNPAPRQHGWPQ